MASLTVNILNFKNIDKGFSLIEIVTSLIILSIALITIFNLIITISSSSFNLEKRALAQEVVKNRLTLINTIEKPSAAIERNGTMIMANEEWQWNESFYDLNDEFYEMEIIITLQDADNFIYIFNGYVTK
ncbi:MAG: type II secretion system protein GspI [Gammaproteobacteria bacterium]|nr:type II secretion system protein GspI [Gammaproteobacteria bacterium]